MSSTPPNNILDIAIIGSGPAAFTAALYAARENLSVTIYEQNAIGGLTGTISKIENFPGFHGTGAELIETMQSQATSFGAKVEYGQCTALQPTAKHFELTIDDEPVHARAVIVATGSERRKLGIPGEDLPGISYCATCDGPLTADKEVIVIGGGNSAIQEAFYLLKYAKKVTIINRSPLRCSDVLKKRLAAEPRITVVTGATPVEFTSKNPKISATKTKGSINLSIGSNRKFAGLKTIDKDGTQAEFSADFAFIFIGNIPATSFLPPEILSEDLYVKTDHNFATSIPGLFAAGDCRHHSVKQSIVAAGEGASAAVAAGKYLETLD